MQAWRLLGEKTRNAELLLIGGGTKSYEKELDQMASLCPNGNVRFCGFVDGQEKYRLLGSLTALCVPSLQENFGMTVLESLAMETPVIASKTTPWKELETEHCGWWVNNNPNSLAETLLQALNLSEADRTEMGKNGKKLLSRKYQANVVARQMMDLYHWLTSGGVPPEFIEFEHGNPH